MFILNSYIGLEIVYVHFLWEPSQLLVLLINDSSEPMNISTLKILSADFK